MFAQLENNHRYTGTGLEKPVWILSFWNDCWGEMEAFEFASHREKKAFLGFQKTAVYVFIDCIF